MLHIYTRVVLVFSFFSLCFFIKFTTKIEYTYHVCTIDDLKSIRNKMRVNIIYDWLLRYRCIIYSKKKINLRSFSMSILLKFPWNCYRISNLIGFSHFQFIYKLHFFFVEISFIFIIMTIIFGSVKRTFFIFNLYYSHSINYNL